MFGNESLGTSNCKFGVSQGYSNMASRIREAQLQNLKHMLILHKYLAQKYLNKKVKFTSKQQWKEELVV